LIARREEVDVQGALYAARTRKLVVPEIRRASHIMPLFAHRPSPSLFKVLRLPNISYFYAR
jgi:hypothetical protein